MNDLVKKKEKNIKKFIPPGKFHEFEKTEYDFEALERMLNESQKSTLFV